MNLTKTTPSILFSFMLILFGCPVPPEPDPMPQSPAEIVVGEYEGNVRSMPQGINLGRFAGCIVPNAWETNFREGTGTVSFSKINDSTVSVSMLGNLIPSHNTSPVVVSEKSNHIFLKIGNKIDFGVYDKQTNVLTISTRTGSYYINNVSCLVGLPYYVGNDILLDGYYNYTTIGHIDFQGTKK